MKRPTLLLFAVLLLAAATSAPVAEASELQLKYFALTQGRLAFTLFTPAGGDIYVIDFDKIEVKPLVATPANEEFPAWSPDGTRLAYYSNAAGDNEIYTVAADGSDVRRLTNSRGADEDPHFSPDGKKIVFSSERLGPGSMNIFIMDADGSNATPVTQGPKKNTVPKWSPRGTEILYSTNNFWPGWDLMLYDLRAHTSTQLTRGYRSFCRGGWSPDGSAFAFSYGSGDDIEIWLRQKAEVEPTVLIENPGKSYDAEWSDDGKRLFFTSEKTPGSGKFELYVLERDTGQTKPVLSAEESVRYLSWTPLPAPPSKAVIEPLPPASPGAVAPAVPPAAP